MNSASTPSNPPAFLHEHIWLYSTRENNEFLFARACVSPFILTSEYFHQYYFHYKYYVTSILKLVTEDVQNIWPEAIFFTLSLYPRLRNGEYSWDALISIAYFDSFYAFLAHSQEMNANRVGHVCLSVRVIQLEKRWTYLDEIWYWYYSVREYPEIVIFNFLLSVMQTCWTDKLMRFDRH